MPEEKPYNKREQDLQNRMVAESFDRLFKVLDDHTRLMNGIESSQTANSMEIALIKDTIKDYPDMKVAVSGLTNTKYWVIGALAVVMSIGAIVVYLVNDKIDTKISLGIDTAFNQRFQKIQVINNN